MEIRTCTPLLLFHTSWRTAPSASCKAELTSEGAHNGSIRAKAEGEMWAPGTAPIMAMLCAPDVERHQLYPVLEQGSSGTQQRDSNNDARRLQYLPCWQLLCEQLLPLCLHACMAPRR